MKIKEYLINLLNKIKFDETGQWNVWSSVINALKKEATKTPMWGTGTSAIPQYYAQPSAPSKAYTPPTTSVYGGGYGLPTSTKQPIQTYSPTGGTQPYTTTPPKPAIGGTTTGGGGTTAGGTAGYVGQPTGGFAMPQYQGFDWRSLIPQAPAAPQVTAQMIAEWLSRATTEAGLMYDPQAAGIGRELETSLLASEQSKGAIPGYYQDIMEAIKEWQKTTTEEEQRRWYARGLGQGGGLIEAEKGISESALKETTKAETEKARLLTEITQQEELLKKQAGQKTTEIDVARSQYITSRSAELREKYETNQTQISQQQYQNQMEIAKFGFTAETQAFQNKLQQAELANANWYNSQLISLEKQSMDIAAKAAAGMATTTDKYENMFTLPTGQKVTAAQAFEMGYIPGGQYTPPKTTTLTSWEEKAKQEEARQYLAQITGGRTYPYVNEMFKSY